MIGKKLKRSAKKITMPSELKERILEKCDYAETEENQAEEITFTVEPFRPHRIRRIVSVAAAAVVITGIAGYAGHLISRDGSFSDTETSTEITTEATTDDIPVPFANLNGKLIRCNGYRGIIPTSELDETKSQQLADFFRTVEWQYIPSSSPETLANSVGVGGVNIMNFYYCDTDGTENPIEYITVCLDNGIVSYTVDEYEDGQLVSGYNYYYKIDEKAFLDGIISLLYGDSDLAPPFDVSAVNAYKSTLDDRQLTEDETAMIADAFRGWNWSNEIDTKPDGEPEYIFTDVNFLEIAVYENDTVVVHNNKEFHGYSDVSGTQGSFCTYLKVLLDEYADAYSGGGLPFSDFAGKEYSFNGEVIPEKKRIKIAKSFNNYVWHTIDTLRDDYMGDIAYQFTAGDEYLTIYRDGVLECKNAENVKYYEIDFEEVNTNLSDILYDGGFTGSTAPFGDISGMKVTEHGNVISEEKVNQLAEFFNNYIWHEIESDVPYQIPPKIIFSFVIDNGDTTTEITVSNNYGRLSFQNCNNNGVYIVDNMFIDTVNEILYGTKMFENSVPFNNFTIKEYLFNGESLPSKKKIEIAEFFYSQAWSPLDTLRDDYMGGIAYHFTATDEDITIYRDGVLEYRNAENKVTQYAIDFEEFNTNLSNILYDGEFMGNYAPFAENNGCTVNFSGYREFLPESELTETQTEKMEDFFSSLQWQEIEEPEIKGVFYPTDDTISFTKEKDGYSYTLSFSMNNLNLATYNVNAMIPLDDGMFREYHEIKYFSIDENLIREAVAMNLADGGNLYTPFGTLYKMTDSLYCESNTYTGELTGDKLKDISTAFLGWNWSDASYTLIEGTPEYTFTNGDIFTIYVYADGTVVWDGIKSADEQRTYVYYNNVDGDDDPQRTTGNLCLMIREILMDNNPVVKTP